MGREGIGLGEVEILFNFFFHFISMFIVAVVVAARRVCKLMCATFICLSQIEYGKRRAKLCSIYPLYGRIYVIK